VNATEILENFEWALYRNQKLRPSFPVLQTQNGMRQPVTLGKKVQSREENGIETLTESGTH